MPGPAESYYDELISAGRETDANEFVQLLREGMNVPSAKATMEANRGPAERHYDRLLQTERFEEADRFVSILAEGTPMDQAVRQAYLGGKLGRGAASTAAEGALFGFSDELRKPALMGLHGLSTEEAEREVLDDQLQRRELRRQRPKTAAALEIAPALATTALPGVGITGRGAQLFTRGAAHGGLGALGRAEGEIRERLPSAALGAATGGAFAVAAPAVAEKVLAPVIRRYYRLVHGLPTKNIDTAQGFQGIVDRVQKAAPIERSEIQRGVIQAIERSLRALKSTGKSKKAVAARTERAGYLVEMLRRVLPDQPQVLEKSIRELNKWARTGKLPRGARAKALLKTEKAVKALPLRATGPAAVLGDVVMGGSPIGPLTAMQVGTSALGRAAGALGRRSPMLPQPGLPPYSAPGLRATIEDLTPAVVPGLQHLFGEP